MSLTVTWPQRLETALGSSIRGKRPLAGGDINEAYEVELDSGERVFVKTNPHTPPRMFEAEARGLEFLRRGLASDSSLVVPQVRHQGGDFLVLELLDRSSEDQSDDLGRGLAELHLSSAEMFGAPEPNFIGTLGQINEPLPKWVDFFRERRLNVQLELPGARRLIDAECRRRFEILFNRLEELLVPEEQPARLHGDLWGGNWFASTKGPAIFDPAAYGGHREVDWAMMKLFGGFSERTFAAYNEVYPLSPGYQERLFVYQLYPLLVHVNLFGSSYVGSVQDTIRRVT